MEPDDFHQLVSRNQSNVDDGAASVELSPSPAAGKEGKDEPEAAEDKVESASVHSPKGGDGEYPCRRPFQFSDFASAQPPSSCDRPPPDSPDGEGGGGGSEASSLEARRSGCSGEDEEGGGGRRKRLDSARSRASTMATLERSVSECPSSAAAVGAGTATEGDEEVFRVTTQTEMDSMMSEYRHQKGKRTMPSSTNSGSSTDTPPPPSSAGARGGRMNPFLSQRSLAPRTGSAGGGASPSPSSKSPLAAAASPSSQQPAADPEIASQQNASLMADSQVS